MEKKLTKVVKFVKYEHSSAEFVRRAVERCRARSQFEKEEDFLFRPESEAAGADAWTQEKEERVTRLAKHFVSVRLPETSFSKKVDTREKEKVTELASGGWAMHATVHEVDVLFAQLHADAKWLQLATESLWLDARNRASKGLPFGFRPTVLLGPPGSGKSTFARNLAAAVGVPSVEVDAGSTGGVFDLQGLESGWSSSKPGRLVSSCISTHCANPVVVLDELDAGGSNVGASKSGSVPGLFRVLLGLLEQNTSKSWVCPYFGLQFDFSHVSWVFTSNSLDGVPDALLSRVRVVSLEELSFEEVQAFLYRSAAAQGLENTAADAAANVLRDMKKNGRRVDLRTAARALEVAQAFQCRPTLN